MARIVLICAALTASAAGCGSSRDDGATIVAAFYPLAFVAQEIVGEGTSVRNLTPAGAEPHDLELTAAGVGALRRADAVIYVGGGFMPGLEGAITDGDDRAIDVLDGLQLLEGGTGAFDPHVWLDPRRLADVARRVGRALGRPERGDLVARRLLELDQELSGGLENCARRELVTSHAAFAYLADRYGLEQLPLEGLAPEAEPAPRDLAALVARVRATGATTVFTEPLVSPRLAETVAREAGVRTAVLDPLEGLTPDAARSWSRLRLGDEAEPRRARGGAGVPLAVELRGVSFSYRTGTPVLTDASLAVEPGEFVAIAGPNGGGKTTLLRLLLGLEEPARGTVALFGEPPARAARTRRIAYLPQRVQVGGEAPVTVTELVASGRVGPRSFWGPLRRADKEAVTAAIDRVGLAPSAHAPLRTLSGGMQQRAFIAKALASSPDLLVLDEPTTGVDAASQETLGVLLASLRRDLGVTILYVSHEFGAVEHVVRRIVLVRGGIVFDGHPHDLPAVWHDPSHSHA